MTAIRHRIHVVPFMKRVGGRLLPEWLAITIGRDVFAWRELNPEELRHELAHVSQWQRYGAAFAIRYLAASIRAWRSGAGWYRGNRFEVEARQAGATTADADSDSNG